MMSNPIAEMQNTASVFKYLKARASVFKKANIVFMMQIVLTAVVPAAFSIAGIWFPDKKGHFAAIGLAIAVLDVSVIDRYLITLSARAAKLSEEFDCKLFSLSWSDILVGTHILPETVHEYEQKCSPKMERELKDWYPKIASEIPMHLGIVLCQRTNLWYDSELRSRYASVVKWNAISIFLICLGLAWYMNYSVQDMVLIVFAPVLPFFFWSMRTFSRQIDVSAAQARNLASADKLWLQGVQEPYKSEDILRVSRELQSAIFLRRSSSPLIFPFFYRILRRRMEDRMENSAMHLVQESGLISEKGSFS